MKLIEKITQQARIKGWTQAELASSAGLPSNRISKWSANQGEPTARQAYRIAKALGVSLEYLLNDEATDPTTTITGDVNADERLILEVYRALGLTKVEAIRRLSSSNEVRGLDPRPEWAPQPIPKAPDDEAYKPRRKLS